MSENEHSPASTDGGSGNVNAKLQRWVDLLAALLGRQRPATFDELAREIPEYDRKAREALQSGDDAERGRRQATLKRTFERDKQELRTFGVPIESVPDANGNEEGAYQLKTRDFYLPYLSFMSRDGVRTDPPHVDRHGYRALATLTLDHDELAAVVHAAAAARGLGDPMVASAVDGALRKLAVDLPVDAVGDAAGPQLVLPRSRPSNKTFEVLSDALHRGKRVGFDYHALSTNAGERRDVEPYGLFFQHGHWYLVARDRDRDALRNFRLNRVSAPRVNTGTPLSRDFTVPPSFRLREHAASRHAWELGDSDSLRITVRTTGTSGPARAAGALGAPVPGSPELRTFDVRRTDTFARWVLSSAGALVPVAPESFVAEYRALLAVTRAVYERAATVEPTRAVSDDVTMKRAASTADRRAERAWTPGGAAAQLRRVLQLIPRITDGQDHELVALAQELGTDVSTVHGDCYSLVDRYDEPAGFVAGVQILLE
ncbi:MAG TPA: WYL domain-containing protein, partial [Gemmatimonas sp.]|nr:WYL domain-containing protein [Gemmatimonas sp.]